MGLLGINKGDKVMGEYRIVPKRDFGSGKGFWLKNSRTGNYGWVKSGFVVTDGICNIMPGATWFQTIPEAIKALDVWLSVRGNAKEFWDNL